MIRSFINPVGKLADHRRLSSQHQFQQFHGCPRDLADMGESSGVQAQTGFGADARQPFVGQRMQKVDFLSVRYIEECGRLVEFGGIWLMSLLAPKPWLTEIFSR